MCVLTAILALTAPRSSSSSSSSSSSLSASSLQRQYQWKDSDSCAMRTDNDNADMECSDSELLVESRRCNIDRNSVHDHEKYVHRIRKSNSATKQFNKKLQAIGRSSPELAEDALFQAFYDYRNNSQLVSSMNYDDDIIIPDVYSFTICIKAWGAKKNPSRAQDLFDKFCDIVEKLSHIQDRTQTCAEMEEQQLFSQYLYPNIISYHAIVRAWCSVGKIQQAKLIVEKMELVDDGSPLNVPEPDTAIYNCLIDGLTKHLSSKSRSYRKISSRAAAKEADQILAQMNLLHQVHSMNTCPDVITYNSILHLLALSGNYRQADKILKQMETGEIGCKPDVVSYSTVIDSYVKGKARNAVVRANALLEKVENSYQVSMELNPSSNNQNINEEILKPNIRLYSSAINAFAKSSKYDETASIKARKLLRKMERLYSEGEITMRPNKITYNTVIYSHCKSSEKGAPLESDSIFQKMIESGLNPDRVTYNSLMNVWANANVNATDSSEISPVRRVFEIFDDMLARKIRPSVKTMNTILNVLSRHGDVNRTESFLKDMEVNYNISPDICS